MNDLTETIAKKIHLLSASWVIVLAFIIIIDVIGRYLFASPLPGTTEIVKNSIVTITFLQIPLAVFRGDMIRTTILYDRFGSHGQKYLQALAYVCGFAFFLAISWSSIDPAIEAFGVREYEGEGALRVPTYPVRMLIVVNSLFVAYIYAAMLVSDWKTWGSRKP